MFIIIIFYSLCSKSRKCSLKKSHPGRCSKSRGTAFAFWNKRNDVKSKVQTTFENKVASLKEHLTSLEKEKGDAGNI